MKINIKRIISIFIIFSLVGCTTTSTLTTGIVDSRNIEKHKVIIDNFNAIKSRGALFAQGRIVNKSGSELEDIELEARGYNKNGELISTDRIKLVPNRLKNNEKVSFNATFTGDIDQIDSYYFVGKFDSIKTAIKLDWQTLGVILLSAGAVAAIATAAYYGQGSSRYSYLPNYQQRPIYQQQTPVYYTPQRSISTQSRTQISFVNTQPASTGGVFGKYNPNNPFSEYASPFGNYNPNNPFSEYTSPFGSMNPNNPFSEVSSPFGSMNPNNPFSEVSSPFGKLNLNNPFSEVSNPFGKFNPDNPFGQGIHPYYYQKYYLEDDE